MRLVVWFGFSNVYAVVVQLLSPFQYNGLIDDDANDAKLLWPGD